jgi:hypothetical protein
MLQEQEIIQKLRFFGDVSEATVHPRTLDHSNAIEGDWTSINSKSSFDMKVDYFHGVTEDTSRALSTGSPYRGVATSHRDDRHKITTSTVEGLRGVRKLIRVGNGSIRVDGERGRYKFCFP